MVMFLNEHFVMTKVIIQKAFVIRCSPKLPPFLMRCSCQHGRADLVKWFIQKDSTLHPFLTFNGDPFRTALRKGHTDVLAQLIQLRNRLAAVHIRNQPDPMELNPIQPAFLQQCLEDGSLLSVVALDGIVCPTCGVYKEKKFITTSTGQHRCTKCFFTLFESSNS